MVSTLPAPECQNTDLGGRPAKNVAHRRLERREIERPRRWPAP
jgi:hypothetical protein